MTDNKKLISYIPDLLFLAAIAAFGFWVNRSIVIKGLYMDDLYMWSCYGEQSLAEFVLPIGSSSRFRPVYWLAAYLQMMLVGSHITRFVSLNIVLNVLTAYLLYYIARRLSAGSLISFIVGICYLASRFAYYQIGQALGLMETMALFMAIAMLWQLYRYMTAGRGFWASLVIYFLLVFTHERYLSLFPLIYLVLIFRAADAGAGNRLKYLRSNYGKCILPAAELIVITAIRFYAIGKAIPAGTGGTEVTDTFSFGQTVGFCIDQLKYILGINAGPEYLNGLTFEDTPDNIRRLIYIGIVLIAAAVIVYIADILRNRAEGRLYKELKAGLLFCGFIALCIGCSSVTIRLEMRWIYVSYAAALLYAAYMAGSIGNAGKYCRWKYTGEKHSGGRNGPEVQSPKAQSTERHSRGKRSRGKCGTVLSPAKAAVTAVLIAYALITIYVNIFYRGYYIRLYLWPNQLRMNSLAEQTVEKYGLDGVLGKNIYILGNSYEMSQFYADTFFKTFDPDKKAEGTSVIFAETADDIDRDKLLSGEAIVLREVPEDNAYLDITEELASETQQQLK